MFTSPAAVYDPERYCECPAGEYNWPLEEGNQAKNAHKNIAHAPICHILNAFSILPQEHQYNVSSCDYEHNTAALKS